VRRRKRKEKEAQEIACRWVSPTHNIVGCLWGLPGRSFRYQKTVGIDVRLVTVATLDPSAPFRMSYCCCLTRSNESRRNVKSHPSYPTEQLGTVRTAWIEIINSPLRMEFVLVMLFRDWTPCDPIGHCAVSGEREKKKQENISFCCCLTFDFLNETFNSPATYIVVGKLVLFQSTTFYFFDSLKMFFSSVWRTEDGQVARIQIPNGFLFYFIFFYPKKVTQKNSVDLFRECATVREWTP